MGMIDGPNVYAYVGNNPVNFVDHWGNQSVLLTGGLNSIEILINPHTIGLTPIPEIGSDIVITELEKQQVNPNGIEKGNETEVNTTKTNAKSNNQTKNLKKGDKGKTENKENEPKNIFEKIIDLFKKKGFISKGPSPDTGKGAYVNPKTGRKFHLDDGEKYNELPHVDIHRDRGVNLPKRRMYL
jgi:hypothetical protein